MGRGVCPAAARASAPGGYLNTCLSPAGLTGRGCERGGERLIVLGVDPNEKTHTAVAVDQAAGHC